MKREKEPLTTYLPPPTKAALEKLARDNRRTIAAEIQVAIEERLEREGVVVAA